MPQLFSSEVNTMNTRRSYASLRNRHASSEWLSLALGALLALPPAAFAAPWATVSARSFGADTSVAPLAPTASIVVNTTGDGDNVDAIAGCDADTSTTGEQCTLRAAIQRANALAGDDTISFNIPGTEPGCDAMTSACTVNLTKVLPDLSTNIEINGPGADKLTVRRDTGGDYRIFRVTNVITVTFSGMTISNGKVTGSEFGGGIESSGTVNVVSCTLSGNSTDNTSGAGGGGGGIASGGTLNITNSLLFGNTSTGTSTGGGFGGGINSSGTLTVTNSTFRVNSARQGSGIVNAGAANITNTTFRDNQSVGLGGAINNTNFGTIHVTMSTISHNTAGAGGGILNGGELTVSNSAITDNTCSQGGGGIVNMTSGTVEISNSTISNNSSNQGAGGIFNFENGVVTIDSSTVNGNSTGSAGGAIAAGGSSTGHSTTTNIINSTVNDNSAANDGGGIFMSFGSTVNVVNSTISNNFTGTRGGGIAGNTTSSGNLTANVTNSTIYNNKALGGDGGGIFTGNHSAVNLTNSTISGNTALKGGGVAGGGTNSVRRVKSSIIAINRSVHSAPDVSGVFTSGGFNLIGESDGSTGFTNGVNNDQVGTSAVAARPETRHHAGLQNNGGPTQTIALLADSPAIDKGTAAGLTGALTTDQRGTGFTRTFNDPAVTNAADGTDIGAFERNPAAPTPTPTPTPTATPTPTPTPSPTPTPDAQHPRRRQPCRRSSSTQPVYAVEEGCHLPQRARLALRPSSAATAAVDITSEDGTAKQKGDYTLVVGHLVFAAGETEKTFQVLINDDATLKASSSPRSFSSTRRTARSARRTPPRSRSRTTRRRRPRTRLTTRAPSSARTTTTSSTGSRISRARTSGRSRSKRAAQIQHAGSPSGWTSRPPSSSRLNFSRPVTSSSARTRPPSATSRATRVMKSSCATSARLARV